MLAGDFTAFASPACNGGTRADLGAPFVGNRVDPALFSKAALNITSRLPKTDDPCGLVQYGLPSATDDSQFVGKLDYQLSSKHSLFGRYIATKQFTPPPFSLEAAGAEPAGDAHRRPGQPGADLHDRRELRASARRR